MRRVHAIVTGTVQGVGYRFTLQHVVERAHATGWVRNLRDGSVEAEIEGEGAAVEAVLDWMREGPRGGDVTGVEVAELSPTGGTGFEVRRDG